MQNNTKGDSPLSDQELANAYWRDTEDYNYSAAFPERHKNQIAFAQKWLLPRLKPIDHVLDLGCADGWFAFLVSRRVQTIDAFDISEKLLARARDIASKVGVTNIHFELADVSTLTLTETYNHVFCMGLFTCILDDSGVTDVLSKVWQYLAPGGSLAVKDTLSQENDRLYKTPNYRAQYRSRDNYVALIEKAGFRLVGEEYLSQKGVDSSISKCFLFEKQG